MDVLVLPIEAITAIQRLASERGVTPARLASYVDSVRSMLEGAGPRGRALLRQLEAVLRPRTPR